MKRAKSNFRNWVYNLWIDNIDERQTYKELPFTQKEYWERYKWWLKREYQHQTKQKPRA